MIISGIIADPDENEDKQEYRRRYYNFINNKLELISSLNRN